MGRHMAAVVLIFLGWQAVSQASEKETVKRLVVPPGLGAIALHGAIVGAARRLENPACQRLLTDFHDDQGRTLRDNLDTLERTPGDYLMELWFVDASDGRTCLAGFAAFTEPGSRVVSVCGRLFGSRQAGLEGWPGEVRIIHEMLHSLGLSENPPTSNQITRQVMTRCR